MLQQKSQNNFYKDTQHLNQVSSRQNLQEFHSHNGKTPHDQSISELNDDYYTQDIDRQKKEEERFRILKSLLEEKDSDRFLKQREQYLSRVTQNDSDHFENNQSENRDPNEYLSEHDQYKLGLQRQNSIYSGEDEQKRRQLYQGEIPSDEVARIDEALGWIKNVKEQSDGFGQSHHRYRQSDGFGQSDGLASTHYKSETDVDGGERDIFGNKRISKQVRQVQIPQNQQNQYRNDHLSQPNIIDTHAAASSQGFFDKFGHHNPQRKNIKQWEEQQNRNIQIQMTDPFKPYSQQRGQQRNEQDKQQVEYQYQVRTDYSEEERQRNREKQRILREELEKQMQEKAKEKRAKEDQKKIQYAFNVSNNRELPVQEMAEKQTISFARNKVFLNEQTNRGNKDYLAKVLDAKQKYAEDLKLQIQEQDRKRQEQKQRSKAQEIIDERKIRESIENEKKMECNTRIKKINQSFTIQQNESSHASESNAQIINPSDNLKQKQNDPEKIHQIVTNRLENQSKMNYQEDSQQNEQFSFREQQYNHLPISTGCWLNNPPVVQRMYNAPYDMMIGQMMGMMGNGVNMTEIQRRIQQIEMQRYLLQECIRMQQEQLMLEQYKEQLLYTQQEKRQLQKEMIRIQDELEQRIGRKVDSNIFTQHMLNTSSINAVPFLKQSIANLTNNLNHLDQMSGHIRSTGYGSYQLNIPQPNGIDQSQQMTQNISQVDGSFSYQNPSNIQQTWNYPQGYGNYQMTLNTPQGQEYNQMISQSIPKEHSSTTQGQGYNQMISQSIPKENSNIGYNQMISQSIPKENLNTPYGLEYNQMISQSIPKENASYQRAYSIPESQSELRLSKGVQDIQEEIQLNSESEFLEIQDKTLLDQSYLEDLQDFEHFQRQPSYQKKSQINCIQNKGIDIMSNYSNQGDILDERLENSEESQLMQQPNGHDSQLIQQTNYNQEPVIEFLQITDQFSEKAQLVCDVSHINILADENQPRNQLVKDTMIRNKPIKELTQDLMSEELYLEIEMKSPKINCQWEINSSNINKDILDTHNEIPVLNQRNSLKNYNQLNLSEQHIENTGLNNINDRNIRNTEAYDGISHQNEPKYNQLSHLELQKTADYYKIFKEHIKVDARNMMLSTIENSEQKNYLDREVNSLQGLDSAASMLQTDYENTNQLQSERSKLKEDNFFNAQTPFTYRRNQRNSKASDELGETLISEKQQTLVDLFSDQRQKHLMTSHKKEESNEDAPLFRVQANPKNHKSAQKQNISVGKDRFSLYKFHEQQEEEVEIPEVIEYTSVRLQSSEKIKMTSKQVPKIMELTEIQMKDAEFKSQGDSLVFNDEESEDFIIKKYKEQQDVEQMTIQSQEFDYFEDLHRNIQLDIISSKPKYNHPKNSVLSDNPKNFHFKEINPKNFVSQDNNPLNSHLQENNPKNNSKYSLVQENIPLNSHVQDNNPKYNPLNSLLQGNNSKNSLVRGGAQSETIVPSNNQKNYNVQQNNQHVSLNNPQNFIVHQINPLNSPLQDNYSQKCLVQSNKFSLYQQFKIQKQMQQLKQQQEKESEKEKEKEKEKEQVSDVQNTEWESLVKDQNNNIHSLNNWKPILQGIPFSGKGVNYNHQVSSNQNQNNSSSHINTNLMSNEKRRSSFKKPKIIDVFGKIGSPRTVSSNYDSNSSQKSNMKSNCPFLKQGDIQTPRDEHKNNNDSSSNVLQDLLQEICQQDNSIPDKNKFFENRDEFEDNHLPSEHQNISEKDSLFDMEVPQHNIFENHRNLNLNEKDIHKKSAYNSVQIGNKFNNPDEFFNLNSNNQKQFGVDNFQQSDLPLNYSNSDQDQVDEQYPMEGSECISIQVQSKLIPNLTSNKQSEYISSIHGSSLSLHIQEEPFDVWHSNLLTDKTEQLTSNNKFGGVDENNINCFENRDKKDKKDAYPPPFKYSENTYQERRQPKKQEMILNRLENLISGLELSPQK